MTRLLTGTFLVLTTLAQKGWPVSCGPGYPPGMQCQSLAEIAVNGVRSLGEMAGLKISVSTQLEQARRRFFATYPTGPGHAQAEKEFLHLLDEKDLWYLFLATYLAPAMNTTSGRNRIPDAVAAAYLDKFFGLGVKWDGGIRDFASSQFDDWTVAVRRSSTGSTPGTFEQMGSQFAGVWGATEEPYRRYWIARSWAEFAAAGHNVTDDPKTYLRLLFVINRPWNGLNAGDTQMGLADRYYQSLVAIFGEDSVLGAAKRVIAAPKKQNADVILAAGQPPSDPYLAFGKALGEIGIRNFFLMNVMQWSDPLNVERQLASAENTYKRLAAIYGEPKLLETVTQLRRDLKGRTLDSDGRLIGIPAEVDHLLQGTDTRYFVRAILAGHDRLTTQAAVDAAYGRLAAGRGEKAVVSAGDEILAFLKVPYTSVPTALKRTDYRGPSDAYDWLTGILDHSLKLPQPGATNLPENPQYLAWSKYPVGTAVVYGGREWGLVNGKPVPNPISREPFGYWVEVHRIYSLDDESVLVEMPRRPFRGNNVYPVGGQSLRFLHRMDPQQLKEAINKLKSGAKLVSETSGAEPLEVNGKTYNTVWTKTVTRSSQIIEVITRWRSDAVPGHLVREREEMSAGNGNASFKELAIQHFAVDNLATLRTIPNDMFQIKPDLPPFSSEASQIADALSAVPLPAGANPAELLEGQPVIVTTVDGIDLVGIQAGRTFLARLEEPIKYGGQIAVQRGADVYLKARNVNGSTVAITVDSVVLDGKRIAVVTNEGQTMLRVKPQPANTPGVGPARPGSLQQSREVPPQTRLVYLILPGRNSLQVPSPPEDPRVARPVSPAKTGAGAPGLRHALVSGGMAIPAPLLLSLDTAETIDLTSSDDTRRFRSQIAQPVMYQGDILIPAGTDVFLKVIRKGQNAIFYSVVLAADYVTVDGKQIPVRTTQINRSVRIAEQPPPPRARVNERRVPPGAQTLPAHTRLLLYTVASEAR